MNPFSVVLLVLSTVNSVLSIPAASLDADTLRQNGLDAQILNLEFQALHETDPCDSGLTACVGGALAQCAFGSWQLQPCNDSQQCFALPSVRSRGTILTCTSEAHALSLMTAAGTDGGIIANCTNTTVAFPTQSPSISATSIPAIDTNLPASSTLAASASGGVEVVTVTVTLPLTLSPSATMLKPEEAFSILASLSSQGFAISTLSSTTSFPSAPSTETTPSSVGSSGRPDADASCTTIPSPNEPTPTSAKQNGTPVINPYRRAFHGKRRAVVI